MFKSKIIFALIVSFALTAVAQNQTPSDPTAAAPAAKAPVKKVKKVTLNFEDELVSGKYDTPEIMLMNTRKNVKYKDLFNTRNNFIDEIELNRGLFNEHRR